MRSFLYIYKVFCKVEPKACIRTRVINYPLWKDQKENIMRRGGLTPSPACQKSQEHHLQDSFPRPLSSTLIHIQCSDLLSSDIKRMKKIMKKNKIYIFFGRPSTKKCTPFVDVSRTNFEGLIAPPPHTHTQILGAFW